jgi:predicted nucleic acid-binding protein
MTFLDTSAIYALADRGDPNHDTAVERLQQLLDSGEELITHNYVVLESIALIQSRLGFTPALSFAKECATFTIEWVDQSLHASGIRELQKSGKRQISLVDHISFLVMRRRAVTVAFAFDPDFEAAGFQLLEPS